MKNNLFKGFKGFKGKQKLLKFILVSFFVMTASCSTITRSILKDPQIVADQLTVRSFSLDRVSLQLHMKISNPNPIALNLNTLDYHLKFNGETVTEGVFEKGISVPATGTGEVILPLEFQYRSLTKAFQSLMKGSASSQKYALSGNAQFGLFTIPFNKEGNLTLKF